MENEEKINDINKELNLFDVIKYSIKEAMFFSWVASAYRFDPNDKIDLELGRVEFNEWFNSAEIQNFINNEL